MEQPQVGNVGHEVAFDLLKRYRAVPDSEGAAMKPLDADHAEMVESAWRSGRVYNPVFTYQPPAPSPSGRLEELADKAEEGFYYTGDWTLSLFAHHLRWQKQWAQAIMQHDAAQITTLSQQRHGPVEDALREAAEHELRQPLAPKDPEPSLSAERAAHAMTRALNSCNARGWAVNVQPMVARMAVSSQHRVLRLNEAARYTPTEVERLAVHEVGCHVMRSAFGELQQRPLLAIPMGPGSLVAEEGLAVWLEAELGVLESVDRRKYALRVIAVSESQRGSFFDAYARLREHCSAEESYAHVRRAKRGLADTAEPGAYVKDHVYLGGWRSVATHLRGRPEDLVVLGLGKVSLGMLAHASADLEAGQLAVVGDLLEAASVALDAVRGDLARD